MKKRIWGIILSLSLVLTLLPTAALAATTTSVAIDGQTLNASTPYYHNPTSTDEDGYADNNSDGAAAYFDESKGELTLMGLNVNNGNISWLGNTYQDLTIILANNTVNTVSRIGGSAIVSGNGLVSNGSSLTIKGNGTLYAVSSTNNGMWVWKNITIEGGAKVFAQGASVGLCTNVKNESIITVKGSAVVTAVGGKYAFGGDVGHEFSVGTIKIDDNATVVARGGTKAMEVAPTISTSSTSVDKTTSYWVNHAEMSVETTPAAVFAATSSTTGTLSNVSEGMKYKLGYSDWQDVPAGATSVELSGLFTGCTISVMKKGASDTSVDSNIQLFVADMTVAPTYTVTFDTNGGDELDPGTAITGTDGKLSSLPTPTKADHTFNGWYTAATGGTKIESGHVFSADTKIFAQWTENQPANVTLLNDGYPYGKAMSDSSVTLVMDAANADNTTTYQWQTCNIKNGTYENVGTAETSTNTLTLSSPTSGTWYRCVVNGTLTSKAVQVVKPVEDSTGDVNGNVWTDSYNTYYYISNGTVAYMVNSNRFDVVGLYVKDSTRYMIQTSYSENWQMFSSAQASPDAFDCSESTPSAALDALRVAFDETDACAVYFEADLAADQKAFSFGADTQLGNRTTSGGYADSAALIGTVENGALKQVAMIGAASEAEAKESDPAFVIAPKSTTPASKFWIGRFSDREAYGSSTDTKIEGKDSGMTMSWLNVTSGGSVNFIFKVGTAEATGAIRGDSISTATDSVTLELSKAATSIVVKVNGSDLTEENHYTVDATNPLKPVITFKPKAGLTHESVITMVVTLTGESSSQTVPITNNIPAPTTYTVTFDTNGGDELDPGTATTGIDGKLSSLPTPTKADHTFNGWYTAATGGTKIESGHVFSADTKIFAQWTENPPATYTVTFDTNGGDKLTLGTAITGTDGKLSSLPTPTKADHTFNGWYTAATGGTKIESGHVFSADTKIFAQWTENPPATYTVIYTDGVDGHEIFANQVYAGIVAGTATPVFVGTPTRRGYTFTGWTPEVSAIVTGNVIYSAQWEYNEPVYYEPIYRVTVESDDNDIIISNRIWAYGYNTVTLTVTPDEGYVLQSLMVTDSRGNKVEVTDNGDGKYTFIMPYSNVIVDAICVYDLPFTDVTPEDDYFDAVSFLHQEGLINGMGNNLYQPEISFTRAMIATMLHRLADLPAYNVASDLSDVDADTWYTDAVYWGTEAGLITGYPDGSFAPNVDISVRELVVLLYRYAQYAENPDCDKTGWSGATWADAGLAWAEANDILPEGEDLNAPASRALAAQVIYNVYNLLEN